MSKPSASLTEKHHSCVLFVLLYTVGCHVIAPSDMMDNRIASIKDMLHKNGFGGKVCLSAASFT